MAGHLKKDNPRRTDRISLSVPIEVVGTGSNGEEFVEEARTLVINRHGATIVLNRKLTSVQKIMIRRAGKNKQAPARIVGQIGGQASGLVYGVAFQDPSVNIWGIEFPSLDEAEKAVARLLLDCAACQAREVTYLNELETEVFEANGSLNRFCKQCKEWTLWKPGLIDAAPHPSEGNEDCGTEVAAEVPAAPEKRTGERRKNARIQLGMTACIRQPGFGDEVVKVENVSRGGLRFASPKPYLEGSRVEVALPYSAGGANIFVPARIVRAREVPDKGVIEYGVSYMKPIKNRSDA